MVKNWGIVEWALFALLMCAIVSGGCLVVALFLGVHK